MGTVRALSMEFLYCSHLLHAIVLVDEAMANPLSVLGSDIDAEEKNCLIEEKIIEIARILGIAVVGSR